MTPLEKYAELKTQHKVFIHKQLTRHDLFPAPQYVIPPEVTPQGNEIVVNWTHTFYINGEVEAFYLYMDDKVEYSGFATRYKVSKESVYKGGCYMMTRETVFVKR